MAAYPFAEKIFKYTTTSIGDSVYIIGGLIYDDTVSTGLGSQCMSCPCYR